MWQKFMTYIYSGANDPDEIRRRQIISILSRGLLAVFSLALIAILIFLALNPDKWQAAGNRLTIAIALVGILSVVGITQINHRSSRLASFLLLSLLTIVSIFSDTPEELANGRSLFVFTLPIAISSLILSPASSFFFATINSIAVTALAFQSNTLPNITAIAGFFILAIISWLSARGLEQALKDLRIINANLDNLVTERTRELAEALTRERIEAGRNQAILNSIADGVIVFNAENRTILANPALSALTKAPSESLTGITLSEFVQSEDLSPANRKVITEIIEQPDRIESGIRVEWGRKSLSVGVARVQDTATRENIGAVAVFRDVTREAELEKLKENFVAVVSHELRTPLNAIMGLTEMLQEGIYGALNEKQISITGRLLTNITRLLSMVGDLLDEAQIGAGKLSIKPQVFKTSLLLETLHSTMDKIAADKGLALASRLDVNMPENIYGDHQRLQQILINLVNNAIKFTEKGGVQVSILKAENNHWKMEVIDTGVGIPEDEVPYIFETFRQASNSEMRTRQHGGFGLGLSIVKQLVELMNGRITVSSQREHGSTFTVLLPIETGH